MTDDWSDINYGFNPADETINFQSRVFAEELSNLHETATLAVINSKKSESNKDVSIKSLNKNDRRFVTIDNSIKVFGDPLCKEVCFSAFFDSPIRAVAVTADGGYAFLCLESNGCVCVHVPTQRVVCKQRLVDDPAARCVDAFVTAETDAEIRLVVVYRDGTVAQLVYADERCVVSIIVAGRDVDVSMCCLTPGGNVLLLMSDRLYVYTTDGDAYDDAENLETFVKMYAVDCTKFLGLNVAGELYHLCAVTLLPMFYRSAQRPINDFVYVADDNNSLIVADTDTHVQLYAYPSFDLLFDIKKQTAIVLTTPGCTTEDIMYVELHKGTDGSLKELRLKAVRETQAEQRFQKMLERKLYDEALLFATEFDLDRQLIWQRKAHFYVHKLLCTSDDVRTLVTELDKIEDTVFVIESCLNTTCNHFRDVKILFEYADRRLTNISNELKEDDEFVEMLVTLENTRIRLDMFNILYRTACDSDDANEDEYWMKEWVKFREADLILEIHKRITNRDLSNATLLFCRLDHKTKAEMDLSTIYWLLSALPLDIDVNNCSWFLNKFFPLALSLERECLSELISWIVKKVYYMEKHFNVRFPDVALQFVNGLLPFLSVENPDQDVSMKLTQLVRALENLRKLCNNFQMKISLDCLMESPSSVAVTLLKSCIDNEDGFKAIWNGFLLNYVLENDLHSDTVVSTALQEIITAGNYQWEVCSKYGLRYIMSVDERMDITLSLLNVADIPWSKTVNEIAIEAMSIDHRLANDIRQLVKELPVKTVLKSYDRKNMDTNSKSNILFTIRHIVSCDRPTKHEDIEMVCACQPDILLEALLICVHDYIAHGDFEAAFKIIDKTPTDSGTYSKGVLDKLSIMLEQKRRVYKTIDNYVSVVELLRMRIVKHSEPFEAEYYDKLADELKSIYTLDRKHRTVMTVRTYQQRDVRLETLRGLVLDAVENFLIARDTTNCYDDLCVPIEELSTLLGFERHKGLLMLSEATDKYEIVHAASKRIYTSSERSKHLALASVGLMERIGTRSDTDFSKTIIPDAKVLSLPTSDASDTVPYVDGLILARSMTAKAIIYSDGRDATACWHLAAWPNCCYSLVRNCTYGGIKPSACYDPTTVFPPPSLTLDAFQRVFNVYQQIVGKSDDPAVRYVTHYSKRRRTSNDMHNEVLALITQTDELISSGHDLTAFYFVYCLRDSCIKYGKKLSPKFFEVLDDLETNRCVNKLLMNVMSGRCEIDVMFALVLLQRFDTTAAENYIKKCLMTHRHDVFKLQELSKLAIAFAVRYKLPAGVELTHKQNIVRAKWWKRFSNSDIAYNEFFRISPATLVQHLMKCDELEVKHLQEFCVDYQLNLQMFYSMYVKERLLNWKPVIRARVGFNGKRELIVDNDDTELYKSCLGTLRLIDSQQQVVNLLTDVWKQVNFYNYEVYNCILKLMTAMNATAHFKKEYFVLLFLQDYTRLGGPTERELELWYISFPNSTVIDPLSEWRLPNIFLSEHFNANLNSLELIKAEITLTNYTHWLKVVSFLGVKRNDICIYAIKNIITKSILTSSNDKWTVQLCHSSLLEKIRDCVQYISNKEDATAILNALLNNTSGGADLVEICKLCYEYAEKWKDESKDSKVEQAFLKIQKKYFTYSSMHILHVHNLADEKYLRMVGEPNQLIDTLYRDSRILSSYDNFGVHCPDINSAVDDLAALYAIDVDAKRYLLLNEWLTPSPTSELSPNDVVSGGHKNERCDENENNFRKLVLLCKSKNREYLVGLLQAVGLDGVDLTSAAEATCTRRYRALRCLRCVVDVNDIENLMSISDTDIRLLMDKLQIVSELNDLLGSSLTPETLDGYNKSSLIQSLAHLRSQQKTAVKLLASLCRHYRLYKIKYWEFIVERMSMLRMADDMQDNLVHLCRNYAMYNEKWFKNGWETTVEMKLQAAKNQDGDAFEKTCKDALGFVQTSPILSKLDVTKLCKAFIAVRKPEFATILLRYLPSAYDATALIQEILDFGKDDVVAKLQRLDDVFDSRGAAVMLD